MSLIINNLYLMHAYKTGETIFIQNHDLILMTNIIFANPKDIKDFLFLHSI